VKFTINQALLKAALASVQGVADRKSTIPVLQNFLIETLDDRRLQIIGTNLDLAVTKEVEATTISEPGAICISSSKLIGIVGSLTGNSDIRFVKDDKDWVTITCDKAKFRLPGITKDHFPEIPLPKNKPITLNADLFAEMIGKVLFAITNEQSRFTLSGAKFVVANGTVALISTDGHRLSFVERKPADGQPVLNGASLDVLIPKAALNEVAKMGQTGGIQISEDQNHIFFVGGGQMLSARKLTGSFPNYQAVMPSDNDLSVSVDGEALKAAVRRIALMADARNQSMRITAANGELRLFAQSSEEGEGNETVDAEFEGDEIQLGFNWHYLGEFLNLVKPDDKVVLLFKDANAQTEWKLSVKEGGEAGGWNVDDGFRHIIMPLRI
jgi:DNA polymerase-3 subunit beta